MHYINKIPVQPMIHQHNDRKAGRQSIPNEKLFSDHLREAIAHPEQLTISKHANQRFVQRKISISPDEWKRIELKVAEAKHKGLKESLVILNHAAMIVSPKNNTVITVMDRKEVSNQIFTNIDGTIILDD